VALFLVADALAEVFFERRQQVEGDVGGLEASWLSAWVM
jgi:hypothetical protein